MKKDKALLINGSLYHKDSEIKEVEVYYANDGMPFRTEKEAKERNIFLQEEQLTQKILGNCFSKFSAFIHYKDVRRIVEFLRKEKLIDERHKLFN